MAPRRARALTNAPSVDPATPSDARRTAGVVLCLVSACGFGLMAIFAKQAYAAGLGVTALLAARFALAASVFWAIVAMRARRADAPVPRPDRRVVLAGLGLGAIGYAAQAGLFFSALRHIDASLTSLLLYTYPALVFCGAVALGREHVTPRKALALALASAGAGLVLLGGGTHGLEATGVALALGAGATYAIYILVADGVVARIDALQLGALVATGAAATFLLAGALTGALTFTSGGWIWIAAIALVSTVLPIATFMLGMVRVGASTASIVSTAEPVVTVALAVALYSEGLGPLQVVGGVLVLVAVVALQARGARALGPVASRGQLAHESA
jgi:drug/metabolite transporter (DMT)-like permease